MRGSRGMFGGMSGGMMGAALGISYGMGSSVRPSRSGYSLFSASSSSKGLDEAHNTLRKNIVTAIVNDQNKFKTVLQHATSKYINIVKNKCCREDGRVRANNFLDHLKFSNVTVILHQLSLLLKHGNEDPDSLKTILAKSLTSAFLSEQEKQQFSQKYPRYEFYTNSTTLLNDICKQTQSLLLQPKPKQQDLATTSDEKAACKL